MNKKITCLELKLKLYYDPVTGVFINLKTNNIIGCKIKKGYYVINLLGSQYRAHRLAWLYMTGEFPENDIDHINHIRYDNRFINLRSVSRVENGKNQSKQCRNTSGITGVSWSESRGKWTAYICSNGKSYGLGRFYDKFNAICARKSAERKYGFHANHGENPIKRYSKNYL